MVLCLHSVPDLNCFVFGQCSCLYSDLLLDSPPCLDSVPHSDSPPCLDNVLRSDLVLFLNCYAFGQSIVFGLCSPHFGSVTCLDSVPHFEYSIVFGQATVFGSVVFGSLPCLSIQRIRIASIYGQAILSAAPAAPSSGMGGGGGTPPGAG